MHQLENVFKKSGVPDITFVAPKEFTKVMVALRTPGRGVVIEGPSGIGKTSCVKRAMEKVGLSTSCTFLSARKKEDCDLISELPNFGKLGVVVIDDFHRLDANSQRTLTDFLKLNADEEQSDNKIILIGINRAGQSLLDYAPDLLHRIEVIKVGRANDERIATLISQGEEALNCTINVSSKVVEESEGSFAMAQILCHELCVQAGLLETATEHTVVSISLPSAREAILQELSPRFFPVARTFATGNKLRREGRAPYLHLLRWMSGTDEGVMDTKEEIARNPTLIGSVGQVIDKGHLQTLLASNQDVSDLIYYNPTAHTLTAEDPKFLYFIRHIIWSKFARQVGYYSLEFSGQYDFALSFAGEDRGYAEEIFKQLTEREIFVFYDKNAQHLILGNDVEEYLAPIYRSQARFVVALMSRSFPKKIWTKFESLQFKDRFGDGSILPVWFDDVTYSMFDESRNVGGLTIDTKFDVHEMCSKIVEDLCNKLTEDRQHDVEIDTPIE